MKCGLCNEVIDNDEGCMRCGNLFKIGVQIFCIEDDGRSFHYCSLKCAEIKSMVVE